MHEFISAVSPILSLASVLIAIMVGYGTLKMRRDEPQSEWRKSVDARLAVAEEKLGNDYHDLRRLIRESESRSEFEKVALKALKGIVLHEITGDHLEDMQKISTEIDNFLIER